MMKNEVEDIEIEESYRFSVEEAYELCKDKLPVLWADNDGQKWLLIQLEETDGVIRFVWLYPKSYIATSHSPLGATVGIGCYPVFERKKSP